MITYNGSDKDALKAIDKMASEVTLEELVEITKLPPVAEMKKKTAEAKSTREAKEQWSYGQPYEDQK